MVISARIQTECSCRRKCALSFNISRIYLDMDFLGPAS